MSVSGVIIVFHLLSGRLEKLPWKAVFGLSVWQEQFQLLPVASVDNVCLPKVSFAFPGLFCQDMVRMGLSVNEFACSRCFKPFCGGPVCFYFWHVFPLVSRLCCKSDFGKPILIVFRH